MLRQTHMIEKGMSLSEPRKGFGQQKIAVLFEMMDQYLKMGYPSDGMPFQDAIIVLNAYVDMQKGLGYENAAMVEKLKTYDTYRIDGLTAGIKYDTRANLMSNIDKPFPEFFYSRHSMRQFESKSINIEDVEKAAWDVGVACQDGRMFHGPCHLRINLALPLSRVQEAFHRLDKYVFNVE